MTIEKYIESKKFAWSPTTIRSETYRLQGVADFLDGNPETLWRAIQTMKPYARLTLWTRVTNYWQFLLDGDYVKGKNLYAKWKQENARLFKNSYVRQKPEITIEEAKRRIEQIPNQAYRERARSIVRSGLRFTESNHITGGTVRGKGGKTRKVFVESDGQNIKYDGFHKALSKVGLKSHDLRKLFLSRLVDLGINEFELCEIAGWSNINTASSYIKVNASRLDDLVQKARE
jgi:hypothetical protein